MTENKKIFRNQIINKQQLKKLVSWAFTEYGTARTAQMADELKDLGFRYATRAGVSISVEDLQVPPSKRELLDAAQDEIRRTERRYTKGEITEVERFQKVVDTWNGTSEALKDEVVRNLSKTPLNSVYMMAFSGARGNISQVRQLVGMRGLMANPQGEIIDLPIKTNFREGLTVTEYIISSYGARKGLVDTALRTADSGYLTRRLVDVAQDVILREIDCGTDRGIWMTSMTDGERVLIPLQDRLFGRILGADVIHPETGEIVAHGEEKAVRNQPISADLATAIGKSGVKRVFLRSPLTCEANRSVCRHCYGWSLAHANMVDLGEAIGIIAAQSIGEPGTQLTMRTFHTGGVFTAEAAEILKAPFDGVVKVPKTLRLRAFRTRHGDDSYYIENNGQIVVEQGDKQKSINVSQGATLVVKNGQSVVANQVLVEIPAGGRTARKTTEKATKDVATDLAGEIKFADVIAEEKVDRQGNMTRIAARGGLIWILSGEVYNLPPGAEPSVKNGDQIEPNSVLAHTRLVSEHGGIVRIQTEEETANSELSAVSDEITPTEEISSSLSPVSSSLPREIEIITASVLLDQAAVRIQHLQSREQYIIETNSNHRFLLKVTPGTKVENHEVVAELMDDSYRTHTGGIIKYAGVEVAKRNKAKQGYEVIQGGTLLWIPEECHEVNKDISLLLVEDGQYVEAGTEVVKDIFCQSNGVIEVTQKNDILREIVIKPGDLHLVDDPEMVMAIDGQIVNPGQEAIPGIEAQALNYIEYVETPEGPALLLRPVTEFSVPETPPIPSQESLNESISLKAVQRLTYKDGERVRSVEGVELLRTQLVISIGTEAPQLAADIELVPDEDDPELLRLQLVILESLVIRRDTVADATQGSTRTRLLVEDGMEIEPGAVVSRTEILSKEGGIVRGIRSGTEILRRILVMRDSDKMTIDLPAEVTLDLKPGQLVVEGTEMAPGVILPESGEVISVRKSGADPSETADEETSQLATSRMSQLVLRLGRPYRVSSGAVLHLNDGDLVQRGDNLVLLVFERAKTGDIIQGLPRIEELLEARKPKEACVLARSPGTAQMTVEDEIVELRVVENDGTVSDYPLLPGQTVIVSDGQTVDVGQALTDGPANPHEILEVFFNYSQERDGVYEAALLSFQKCQTFLVNEVQSVYQSQGIDISDKHIEVIVRQMTSKVRIDDGGDTTMLPGELIELRQVEQVNEAMSITGGAPARYTPLLLGITKASLNTDSFISAASFQETTRVLTEAAIEGKSDWLRGLKENVIIGRLIPAGSGFNAYEEPGASEFGLDPTEMNYLDQDDELKDVVLDDQTARSYGNSGKMNAMPENSDLFPSVLEDELIDDGYQED